LQNSESVSICKSVRTDAGYFETVHVKYSCEINVKSPSDKKDCCISAAVFLAQHCVAFVDSINCTVKIVDTKTRKITCKKLSSEKS
jgi:hypothetical protein